MGLSDGGLTEVISGLGEKAAIVEANSASIADGQEVERITPPEAAPKAKS